MIIGLAGYARVGKSEAAKGLQPDFKVVAYADKLREFLYTLNPIVGTRGMRLQKVIDRYGWDGYKSTQYNDEIRRAIQTLGTDCGRNMIGPNVWIDSTFRSMNNVGRQDYVIADVRFPNEAQAIVDRGGFIVRIDRPGYGPVNDHASETSMDKWEYDAIIVNNVLPEGLRHLMRTTAKWLAEGRGPFVI